MNKRLNISLPEQTVRLLDRVTTKGKRSQLIDEAVKHFVRDRGERNLEKQLKIGAKARASRDLELSEEWFALPD